MELTILLPCLNEEKTLKNVIVEIQQELKKLNISSEILVVDNNSTDNSYKIAKENGVRIVKEKKKGYGSALQKGIKKARGKYIIFGDSDQSYSFKYISIFYENLKQGNDLVIGNRYLGKMEAKAMPLSHKYIGTPLISFLGKILYGIKVKDFNCGFRGINRKNILNLSLKSMGMEYASEMIIKAKKKNLKIEEFPIDFYKDKRNGKPHLRTIRDGFRHIKLIFKELR